TTEAIEQVSHARGHPASRTRSMAVIGAEARVRPAVHVLVQELDPIQPVADELPDESERQLPGHRDRHATQVTGTPELIPRLSPELLPVRAADALLAPLLDEVVLAVVACPVVRRDPASPARKAPDVPSLLPGQLREFGQRRFASDRREAVRVNPGSRALPRHEDRNNRSTHRVRRAP